MTRNEAESQLLNMTPFVRRMAAAFARRSGLPFDDLVQVGLIAVWDRLPHYDPSLGCEVSTFVLRRVKFSFIDYARQASHPLGWSSRYGHLPAVASLEGLSHRGHGDGSDGPEFAVEDYRQHDSLDDADEFDQLIARLHPREKRAVRLRYQHGLSQVQIASDMRYSESRVSQILAAAVEKLREARAAA